MTNTAATATMRNARTPGPQESPGSYPLHADASWPKGSSGPWFGSRMASGGAVGRLARA